ncbi:MAG: hypothetical protein ACK4SA_15975, partial [Caldilinea sp.]
MTVHKSICALIVTLARRWIIVGGLILTACAPAGPRPLDNIAVTPIPPAPPPAVAPPDQFITLDNANQMAPFARLGTGYIHRLIPSPDG